ncbi:MAG: translation initiation factor IF-2 [Proteobacteria bacterium]|nr:translation initiation factor IF-2 [Pseudomonadota bacterium]
MTDAGKDKKSTTLGVKSGTLSVGTLSTASGTRANASRGVEVEVRKRRDFSSTPAVGGKGPVSPELEEKRRILEEAEKNAATEAEQRDRDRKVAEDLARKRAEEAQRKVEEEAARKAAEEARAAEETVAAVQATARPAEDDRPKTATPVDSAPRRRDPAAEERERNRAAPVKGKDTSGRKKGGRNAYLEDLEQRYRSGRRKVGVNKKGFSSQPAEKIIREVIIPEVITVGELANRMSERSADVVKKLMGLGQMVTITQSIDQETAALLVEEFGHKYKLVAETDIEIDLVEADDSAEDMITRPPVVTVMGHVDHGKTSLLDAIRRTDVVAGEAGGITQHIGAYQVTTKSGKPITFLDTPGHEAFTAMRARGAAVTDVVVLVVAADDGVMPQTVEAIKHAKAAGVPIIVAVNKIDKPEANPDKVKQELLSYELVSEDYGGETIFVHVSAKQGKGIDELEEMILLQSEVLDLQANPSRKADGVVVEAQLDKGRGPVATVIVKRGTLKDGDILVVGSTWGRVRALMNDRGARVTEAGPAMPVEILGLQSVPDAGDEFVVVDSDRRAREVAEFRDRKKREMQQVQTSKMSLDNLFSQIAAGEVKELPLIVKGDVQGSIEAITDAVQKLATDEIKVRVLHSAVGVITESDVMLATASNALIIGFNVRANPQARTLSEREGIEIRYYNVIYTLVDEIKSAMAGMLEPEYTEKVIGQAEIREVFKVSKVGTIAGCMVTSGVIQRNAKVRLIRDGIVIHEGELASLKRFKDDAKEVQSGFECGLSFAKTDDLRAGDQVECFIMEEQKIDLDVLKKRAEERQKAAAAEEKAAAANEEKAG